MSLPVPLKSPPKPNFGGPFNAKRIIRIAGKSHVNGATKLKLYSYIGLGKYLGCVNFFPIGASGDAGPLNVNLGPPDISETTRARKLNLKIPLGMVKYPLGYKNYYIIQYNMRAVAIVTFDKCLYFRGRLQLTTARLLAAYMWRALATTTTSSCCHYFAMWLNFVASILNSDKIRS